MLRLIAIIVLGAAAALTGCGDDSAPADAGPGSSDAGPGGTDAGPGGDTDAGPGDTDAGGGGMGESPVIERIEWAADPGCTAGTMSDVAITVMVMDADTAAGMLSFSGMVSSCTGMIDADTASVACPHFATYNGSVTVMDPEGNSDTEMFSFGPCETGGVDF